MAKKNFLLLSLEDAETRKVANVVSNDSCRKILDYLAEHDSTESELAEKLKMPISTVHYNLQQLMETGLIVSEEYHYSKRGKEMNHYRLANKYIIITPKKTFGIKQKLRMILPSVIIIAVASGFVHLLTTASAPLPMLKQEAADALMAAAPAAGAEALSASSPMLPVLPSASLWFVVGAIVAIITYLLTSSSRKE